MPDAWRFIKGEINFLANIDTMDSAFKPIPVELPDQIYKVITKKQSSPHGGGDNGNMVFAVRMDELTEARIKDLKKTSELIMSGSPKHRGSHLFMAQVLFEGGKGEIGYPIETSAMISIANRHQCLKEKGGECSNYIIEPFSQTTLADLYLLSLYLEKEKEASGITHPILMAQYDLVAICCQSYEDPVACAREYKEKTVFEWPMLPSKKRLFHHLCLNPEYLSVVITRFNGALLAAEHESQIIDIVADYTRQLLLVHPYDDANGRTFRMLANYVLLLYGQAPLAFDEFLPVPMTEKEWRVVVRGAQERGFNILNSKGEHQ